MTCCWLPAAVRPVARNSIGRDEQIAHLGAIPTASRLGQRPADHFDDHLMIIGAVPMPISDYAGQQVVE